MLLIDWVIIILYFIISLAIGLIYSRRASGSTENFFLSGRKLSWWLAGISMVATTFAADTPLAVTELVGQNGIAGNWLWWNMLIGGMLTVFFFSRLWRRAEILTDVEFIEFRYSGKPAAALRGFKAIYMGIFMNTIIMGWVNLAMIKILLGMFPEYVNSSNALFFVGGCMLLTAFYSALSGLWGVAVTDAFQFILAMVGCIILSIIVVSSPQVGGISGLQEKLPDWAMRFTPDITSDMTPSSAGGILALTVSSFLAFIGIQWWASWYPGADPGGGGYIAQRMMSAKDEKNSLYATLFFQIAHYCIRPWPWIIVGLSALVLYPDLSQADKGLGFVKAMNDFLPPGLKGLLLAAFLAAYMSTIATHLNWGTSYFINDFYRRFLSKDRTEKHYVNVSKLMTLVFMVLSILVTTQMTTISGVWGFVIECGAGLGLVLILRWFWWRVNAMSEIVATITPFIVYGVMIIAKRNPSTIDSIDRVIPGGIVVWMIIAFSLIIITSCVISIKSKSNPKPIVVIFILWILLLRFLHIVLKVEFFDFLKFPNTLYLIVPITTLAWLITAFITKPTEESKLLSFYTRVHPGGIGWKKISDQLTHIKSDSGYYLLFINWIAGIILVYSFLFGIGKIIFGQYLIGLLFLLVGIASALVIKRNFDKVGWETIN